MVRVGGSAPDTAAILSGIALCSTMITSIIMSIQKKHIRSFNIATLILIVLAISYFMSSTLSISLKRGPNWPTWPARRSQCLEFSIMG